VYKLGNEE
jgi:hypothetical protein